ncbi:hypothetical protein BEWA_018640 [Theileria equi strain WA]|uniref:Uncharacterized protein n=1 Tax=Theileria equi strain WA TaxID=1537102 RepID=L0AVV3_THEEQ|nr:hypothetical protein BEWA_018640 [Theileria equi strain WA]AFZ79019.1 hypothetical protein BEWA_018640 [Theileria equi strain WA]|eukprot:XP_004828685.1 hypothetical protein BEWA_018640 [Theileria equi strain WA]
MHFRISTFCAKNNLCSKSDAKKYIKHGMLKVNDKIIDKDILLPSDFNSNRIEFIKRVIDIQNNKISLLLHKPEGYSSIYTNQSHKWSKNLLIPENRSDEDVKSNFQPSKLKNLIPIIPLETSVSGLLIYSQNKSLTSLLSDVDEEYHVIFRDILTDKKLFVLNDEIYLDGVLISPFTVKPISNHSAFISLKGSSNKLRRACLLAGLEVKTLKRVRISNVKLGLLLPGKWKLIRNYEIS